MTELASHQHRPLWRTLPRALRVHQWVKNTLIAVPLILAHRASDFPLVMRALWAFAAYSLCASAVYVINDLVDLEADRSHPVKRHRPFASGDLAVGAGYALVPALLGASLAISFMLGGAFIAVMAGYFLATTAYSLALKRVALVDVLLLAGLYTWRIIAGGVAADVPVSAWLLAFSTFVFLSLALIKRSSELLALKEKGRTATHGRGYFTGDLEIINSFGTASGYLAVLVFALYINSSQVTAMYHRPQWLWLACPLLLFWISRMWLIAHRGGMHSDPIVFAIRDPVSYLTGAGVAAVWAAASYT